MAAEPVAPEPSSSSPRSAGDSVARHGLRSRQRSSGAPAPDWRDPFEPLDERGIGHSVQERRNYTPVYGRKHPRHDPEIVRDFFKGYDLTPGQKSTRTRQANDLVNESGDKGYGQGLLMPKFPAPGADPVEPQLRPRIPLPGRWKRHRHDEAFSSDEDRARHLEKDHGGKDFPAQRWHSHQKLGRYLLGSLAKEDRLHDHATDRAFQGPKGAEKLAQHLKAEHDGIDFFGEHTHRRVAPGQHVADRLDIHPFALERLEDRRYARRVYFSIEGTPKADAILTRIIETGAPASVFNVPSVTLWKAPELRRFAEDYLTPLPHFYRIVVVCPDADWFKNPRVLRQALFCREFLRKHGVNACIAAPPGPRSVREKECDCGPGVVGPDGRCANCGRFFKGNDDFLVAGGDLDDLVVVDREARFSLALHADEDGRVRASTWGFAKILGVRRGADRVREVMQRYIDANLVTADGKLPPLALNDWTNQLDWEGETPTLTIRSDQRFRQELVRLGDWKLRNVGQLTALTAFRTGRVANLAVTADRRGLDAAAVQYAADAIRRGNRNVRARDEIKRARDDLSL